MASQVTHVVYGEKVFKRQKDLVWSEFVIGTVFPDIRYLAKLDRDLTHIFETSEEKIPKDDSFNAGKYVHCFIDEKREEIISRMGMYKLITHDYLSVTSIKLVEDFLTYERFYNWDGVINSLNSFPKSELETGVPKEKLIEWHKILQEYFSEPPSLKSCETELLKNGFKKENVEVLLNKVSSYLTNEAVIKIIKETWDKI